MNVFKITSVSHFPFWLLFFRLHLFFFFFLHSHPHLLFFLSLSQLSFSRPLPTPIIHRHYQSLPHTTWSPTLTTLPEELSISQNQSFEIHTRKTVPSGILWSAEDREERCKKAQMNLHKPGQFGLLEMRSCRRMLPSCLVHWALCIEPSELCTIKVQTQNTGKNIAINPLHTF